MMIAPASIRFFVSVASYGGVRCSNASAPPVVRMNVVWTLSLSAIGMPCSGPRILPAARSRSRSSASSSAFGFTVIAACSSSSYMPIRCRYWRTISREVTRPDFSAACISGIVASTTVKPFDELGAAGLAAMADAAGFFVCAVSVVISVATATAAIAADRRRRFMRHHDSRSSAAREATRRRRVRELQGEIGSRPGESRRRPECRPHPATDRRRCGTRRWRR